MNMTFTTPAPRGFTGFSFALLATVAMCSGSAFAQSAEGFDLGDIVAEPTAPAAAAGTPATEAKPLTNAEAGPARYAGSGPELAAYVDRFVSSFSIGKRTTDPFGRYQDPEFKAPEPKILNSKKVPTFKKEPPIPFSDVIAAIQLNIIIPSQKRFLVSTPAGARSLKLGDVFPIQLPNGKRVRVQVKSVTSSAIQFINLDTGEKGVLKPGVMPQGMQRGTDGISAPGMQPDGPDAPIEIQSVVPPISSNR